MNPNNNYNQPTVNYPNLIDFDDFLPPQGQHLNKIQQISQDMQEATQIQQQTLQNQQQFYVNQQQKLQNQQQSDPNLVQFNTNQQQFNLNQQQPSQNPQQLNQQQQLNPNQPSANQNQGQCNSNQNQINPDPQFSSIPQVYQSSNTNNPQFIPNNNNNNPQYYSPQQQQYQYQQPGLLPQKQQYMQNQQQYQYQQQNAPNQIPHSISPQPQPPYMPGHPKPQPHPHPQQPQFPMQPQVIIQDNSPIQPHAPIQSNWQSGQPYGQSQFQNHQNQQGWYNQQGVQPNNQGQFQGQFNNQQHPGCMSHGQGGYGHNQKVKKFGHHGEEQHFTKEELANQEIAKQNRTIVLSGQYPISPSETIIDGDYAAIYNSLYSNRPSKKPNTKTIIINTMSTIGAAIEAHKKFPNKSICVLNFADGFKWGGGYLNGRSPQEETLCRQTLLYPTLERNDMYSINAADKNNIFMFDTMIYSPDVFVIRDDKYDLLNEKAFKVNVISSPAVDNRKKNYNYNSETIMERRIRKIVMVAAYKKNNILILGAFGCGVFKNDPEKVSKMFRKVLIEEKFAGMFDTIYFPIYKSDKNVAIFKEALK